MSRRIARECALTALYQLDISMDDSLRVLHESSVALKEPYTAFFNHLTNGVQESLSRIDSVLSGYLKETWTLERLAIIDRTILRMATYELLDGEEPPGAILNEAVELAKTYSSMESSRYINGVLGSMVKELDAIRKRK